MRLRDSCDETSCVRLEHLLLGSDRLNVRPGPPRPRGRTHHHGWPDVRGPAGRARAIRAALADGYHPDWLAAGITAGEPWRQQLSLFPATGTG